MSGEFDLIARLVERLPPPGPRVRVGSGDDAAVTEPAEAASATTVDAVVEGVHFTLPEFTLAAVGRKALAAAVSDLAAMGAEPGEAYVVLGVPPHVSEPQLVEVADGLAEVAIREGIAVVGGDLTSSPVLSLAITCVGYERPGARLVTRAGASPGEVVAVTGELGGAAAALALLRGADPPGLSAGEREALLARQLDPRPRVAAGRALAGLGASAMIDVSDGVGADAGHIADASGVRLELLLDSLPVADGVAAVAGGEREGRELAAGGGEDFELLVTLPRDRFGEAAGAVEKAGTPLTEIGQVAEGGGVAISDAAGKPLEMPLGFDHIRGSGSG